MGGWKEALSAACCSETAAAKAPNSVGGRSAATAAKLAAVVAGGEADCGFGVRGAAERFGLAFTREVSEQYLLVLPREAMHRKPYSLLKRLLSSQAYKQTLGATAGSEARGSGRLIELKQIPSLLRLPARRAARQTVAK